MSVDVIFFTVNTASDLFRRSPMKTSGGVQDLSDLYRYRYTPYIPQSERRLHQQSPLTPQYSPQAGVYSPLSVPPQSVDVPDRGGYMSLLGIPTPPRGRLCSLCI